MKPEYKVIVVGKGLKSVEVFIPIATFVDYNCRQIVKFDILFIVEGLGNGGLERQLFYLVRTLSATHKIGIIPFRYNKEDKYFGIIEGKLPVQIVHIKGQKKLAKVLEIRKFIKINEPDIVHSFCYHLNFATWLVSVLNGPVAFGGIRSRLTANRKRSGFISFYTCLLFPHRKISNNYFFLSGLGWWPRMLHRIFSRTYSVHNGLDLVLFKLSPMRSKIDGTIHTSSISRLYAEKRIDILIDLIHLLKESGVQIKHFHAGTGPLLIEMQKKVDDYDLQDNFWFIGEVQDIGQFLAESDIFFHTAEIEGCPNVTMEAMACGKPILSTNCGDTSLLIRHGRNGYIAGVNNLEELFYFAIQMINDTDKLCEMGQQSRILAEENFSLQAYRDNILKVYEENFSLPLNHTRV